MSRFLKHITILGILSSIAFSGSSQTLPVNFTILQDYLRREQVMGESESNHSFFYRSFKLNEDDFENFNLLSAEPWRKFEIQKTGSTTIKEIKLSLLPIISNTSYNSNHTFGRTFGSFVPNRGIQNSIGTGLKMTFGSLSIQAYPQFHYAQNLAFEEYPVNAPNEFFMARRMDIIGIDAPVRHGQEAIRRVLPSNSHIMVDFGSFTAGISNENIWWGPGVNQALLLSDNAPGFWHGTIRSSKPAKTKIGHFEGQYFAGFLKGSKLPYYSDGKSQERFNEKDNETNRYFTGLSITYSPKWIFGLSLGASRTFQVYRKDMAENIRAWIPLFDPLPKATVGVVENILLREDQHLNLFFRWRFKEPMMEFYGEFIRNDHALNLRDIMLNPEHSRGYILGLFKYINLNNPKDQSLEVHAELIETQNSINGLIRNPNIDRGVNIYFNGQVTHGLTHKGMILGSNLGLSGNSQELSLNIIENLSKTGISLKRIENDPHFYNYANTNTAIKIEPWIDFVIGGIVERNYKNILLSSRINGIVTKNRNWLNNETENNFFRKSKINTNFNLEFRVAYFL